MADDNCIQTRDLVKDYSLGQQRVRALNHVTLNFVCGEFCGVVGPSGSGKTTLLNIMGSLDSPTSGRAIVLDRDIASLTHKEAAQLRNHHFGFIFQTFNLLPVYSVFENVEFPLLLLGYPASERKKMVLEALEWVKLTDKEKARPNQLSGGESQRVAVARAIVKKPKIVFADEPTANLDAQNSRHILNIMQSLNRQLQTTFIFSTHDEKVIQFLRRVVTLEDGRVTDDRVIENSGSES
ncbi:MAG TPA: ABC transporter ATP-binding protein [bacterium]|jgi:putative ABC transport system ATP-binding protein|nr:ABC transporter ATP-binding protein [bacterium]HNT66001.1 ABC transporter ATP-binding protein [bacterium]HOX86066.1 ABC transporter ATP-binding protein [bacterium]HPG45720.1 ABC transporter ATP-binding protein [bacterium]HPM97501.1 ABC transporter ATP-binding protein [bacterium]